MTSDLPPSVPVKKQRFFNKYFFIGLALGIVLTIAAEMVFVYAMVWTYYRKTGKSTNSDQGLEKYLEAPDFETSETLADYNWKMKSSEGKPVTLSDFKGKVIFLNVWATWCPPCRAEMPSIQSLYDKTKSDSLVFVCVSDEEAKTVSKFISEKGFKFPVYISDGKMPPVYETTGIPATFIISRTGKIVYKHIGSARWDDPKSIQFLNNLSAEPAESIAPKE